MTTDWAFAEALWHEHFAPLKDAGFELERTDEANYFRVHEKELRSHFPAEAMIRLSGLRSPEAVAGQARMEATTNASPLRDFCFVREGGKLAAVFCGLQDDPTTYRMWHSNVHTDYRRRGIYRQVLVSTIGYTAALGFDRIESDHAPGNNAILIAKLKAGFRITGMTVTPDVGTSIVVHYFHNPDHLAAYEFRCGLATINPRILANGFGAMSRLASQFRNGDP